jgi:hypothetical protein
VGFAGWQTDRLLGAIDRSIDAAPRASEEGRIDSEDEQEWQQRVRRVCSASRGTRMHLGLHTTRPIKREHSLPITRSHC